MEPENAIRGWEGGGMIDNRLLNNPDYYKWCVCETKETQGSCIGCMIDKLVTEHFGEQGYAYMHTHMAKHGQMIISRPSPSKS